MSDSVGGVDAVNHGGSREVIQRFLEQFRLKAHGKIHTSCPIQARREIYEVIMRLSQFSADHFLFVAALSHVLSWRQFRLYAVIFASITENFEGHPQSRLTQAEMAKECGCSVKTVKNYIQQFEKWRLIRKWRGPDGTNCYRLLFSPGDEVVRSFKEKIPDHEVKVGMRLRVSNKPRPVEQAAPIGDRIKGEAGEKTISRQDVVDSGIPGSIRKIISAGTPEGRDHPPDGLDGQIAQVLAGVKRGACSEDHPTVKFLVHLGFLTGGKLDEKGLLGWLTDREANDFESFCKLRDNFKEDPESVSRTELIKLPMISTKSGMRVTVVDYLNHQLDGHFRGQDWLLIRNGIWSLAHDVAGRTSEEEIRARLEAFMREHGLESLEDAIAEAKRLDEPS